MTDSGSDNLLWADALLDGLAAAGVRRAVISPGSRSTPLVLACDRHPRIKTWSRIDERTAAFFALGMAKQDRSPVALIATSGSAPAHWYPAVIEANHSGTPLILLSADRPPELQECGANQATDQKQLFGTQARGFFDPGPARSGPEALGQIRDLGVEATHLATGHNPGPVHINLPFREPLIPQVMPPANSSKVDMPVSRTRQQVDQEQLKRILSIISQGPGLIVCGPSTPDGDFHPAVAELARRMHTPILADPLSNLRFGAHAQSNIISHYDAFLRRREFAEQNRPEWVLRFGAIPVSKTLLQYLEQSKPTTILCAPRGDWPDPLHQTREMVRTQPLDLCNQLLEQVQTPATDHWLHSFQQQEERVRAIRLENDADLPCGDLLIEQLIQAAPPDGIVFSSNSLPIRHLDSWSGSGAKPLRIMANRGISGIDGNISTLLGLGVSVDAPVLGVLGDLACYHDMNGLLGAAEIDAVIILLNNGGGGIFGYLPQADLEQFEQHWLTPTNLDFGKVAELYSLKFQRVRSQSGFRPALDLAMQKPGLSMIEVILDREQEMVRQQAWLDAVTI